MIENQNNQFNRKERFKRWVVPIVRLAAAAVVLLGGLIWQANDILHPVLRGPLLVTEPISSSTLRTPDRTAPSPWMQSYKGWELDELVSDLSRHHIEVNAQDWTQEELELVHWAVRDLANRLAEIGPGDGPSMIYQTIGRVRLRRMHGPVLLDKLAQAHFGSAKAWAAMRTITIYNSTFYFDTLEVKATIVHELGHVWDWQTRGQASLWLPGYVGVETKPSIYAEDMENPREEWAETVAAWVYPAYTHRDRRVLGDRHREYIESMVINHAPPTRLPSAGSPSRLVSWNIGLGATISSIIFLLPRRSQAASRVCVRGYTSKSPRDRANECLISRGKGPCMDCLPSH